jgi:heme A synthase
MRAIAVAIHLVNTYFLLLTLTVTAWLSNKRSVNRKHNMRIVNNLLLIGIIASILFSAMGAITALGDTLFPPQSLLTDIQREFDSESHFLIRLRAIHPIVAILTSGYLIFVIQFIKTKQIDVQVDLRGKWLQGIIMVQVLAGGLTILTLAPLFMQILHLLLADIFWISLVLFSLENLIDYDIETSNK